MAQKELKTAQEVFNAFTDPKETPMMKTAPGAEQPIDKMKFGYGWPEVSADGWNGRIFDQAVTPVITVDEAETQPAGESAS